MKRFMMRNSEGLYLNTDYWPSIRHGRWRERENARLYKSITGIISAFGAITPAIKTHIGSTWEYPRRRTWTAADREEYYKQTAAFASIPRDKKLALWAEDGFVIEEIEI